MYKHRFGWVVCLLVFASPALGARPLVVDDTEPADRGTLEIETAIELLREDGTRNVAAPFAFTYGLADDLDISLDLGYQWQRLRTRGEPGKHQHGLLDTVVSMKWKFREQDRQWPAMALKPAVKFPTASENRGLGTGEWDAGLLFLATWDLDRTGIDLNAGYTFVDNFHRPFREGELLLGAAVRRQIDRRLWIVGEIVATAPAAHIGNTIAGAAIGFTFDLSDRATLDAAIGTGIGADSADITATVGITWLMD